MTESKSINAGNSIEGDVNDGNVAGRDINYGIPIEQFTALTKELGVTQNALENFFKILQQKNVAPSNYDYTLRQIAERYHNLLAEFQANERKPQVQQKSNYQENLIKFFTKKIEINFTLTINLLKNAKFKQLETHINQSLIDNLKINNKTAAANDAYFLGKIEDLQLEFLKAKYFYKKAVELMPVNSSYLTDVTQQ